MLKAHTGNACPNLCDILQALQTLNQAATPFTERDAATWVYQILTAISHLHKHNIMHRQLKLENILFDRNKHTKEVNCIIAGLNSTCQTGENTGIDEVVGSNAYLPPEMVSNHSYDEKVDIWAVGVLTCILITG